MQPREEFYDVIVVGAGPAGLAAGVYGASEGLQDAHRRSPRRQAGGRPSSRIENYLGFPERPERRGARQEVLPAGVIAAIGPGIGDDAVTVVDATNTPGITRVD